MKRWLIRDEQLRAFEEPLREDFLLRLGDHLRAHFERSRDLPPAELARFVEGGVAQAARHGITTERDLCKFLGLCVVLGADFAERLEWAKRILSTDAGPTLKTNRLVLRATAELRREP